MDVTRKASREAPIIARLTRHRSRDRVRTARLGTPFGPIAIEWDEQFVRRVVLAPSDGDDGDPLPDAFRCQFEAYLADPGHPFRVPLRPIGTAFQQRVWAALRAIPPGATRTYGDLAATLETAPRAIGQACRTNPLPILIPCHRVVARSGLGGFSGENGGRQLAIKRWLLQHEGYLARP
ncbi:methylated-DNA--[protein]-cysteine S-methyltransferase [Thioalkalicoccus limnaeus]|uniref:Methylated-DNA--[protein]-cysteine S-methyltransferase n=1 Tax=Thioalkalicoccus limnaeus TaxID=120681 RepID=A0ABV4BD78_9GAMM